MMWVIRKRIWGLVEAEPRAAPYLEWELEWVGTLIRGGARG